MQLNQRIRLISAIAIASLGSASILAGQETTSAVQVDSSSNCPNTGAVWEDPEVVYIGPDACAGAGISSLSIGENMQGQDVLFSSSSCPTEIKIKPGHKARAPKSGTRVITPTPVPYTLQKFNCIEDALASYCVSAGSGSNSAEVAISWDEETCDPISKGSDGVQIQ